MKIPQRPKNRQQRQKPARKEKRKSATRPTQPTQLERKTVALPKPARASDSRVHKDHRAKINCKDHGS